MTSTAHATPNQRATRAAGDTPTAIPPGGLAHATPTGAEAPTATRSVHDLARLLRHFWITIDEKHSVRAVEAIGREAAERLLVVLREAQPV